LWCFHARWKLLMPISKSSPIYTTIWQLL
jgi:hypothetical protein